MRLFAPVLTLCAALSMLGALLLSSTPEVSRRPAPGAEQVRAAREAALELVLVLMGDGTPRRVGIEARQLDGISAVAGHGLTGTRVDLELGDGRADVRISRRIAARTWVNLSAIVTPDGPGFPQVRLRVGAVPLPDGAARLGLSALRRWAAWQGVVLPEADAMVRDIRIADGVASATVSLPREGVRLIRRAVGGGERIDIADVRPVYGRLLALQAAAPAGELAEQVRRAFGTPGLSDNRAAFVALAMFVVDPRARRVVESLGSLPPCLPDVPVVRLAGRDDLAKHWTMSAALASAIDPQFGRAMGEWKELDDSLPGGSGFSFVDLAADRAGLRAARLAADPGRATDLRERLARATDSTLLPRSVLSLPEGLSERQFARRYGSLDAGAYAAAVGIIDRRLAATPLFRP